MAGDYDALKNKQAELIRKAKDGSVFLAPITADMPADDLTTATGTGANKVITLDQLPDGWDDLGYLTTDGAQFSRDVAQSEITSWGAVSPTRTDITSDTSALTVVCQETKMLTVGLATGADLENATVDKETGALIIKKPARARSRSYRAMSFALDYGDFGEIYIARLMPRAKVTNYAEQQFGGEGEIQWGVTLTGEEDSTLGYSESWFFGGQGWDALVTKMGFTRAA